MAGGGGAFSQIILDDSKINISKIPSTVRHLWSYTIKIGIDKGYMEKILTNKIVLTPNQRKCGNEDELIVWESII